MRRGLQINQTSHNAHWLALLLNLQACLLWPDGAMDTELFYAPCAVAFGAHLDDFTFVMVDVCKLLRDESLLEHLSRHHYHPKESFSTS